MWVILPVKRLHDAKNRLSEVLTTEQRACLSKLMLIDVMKVLASSDVVDGVLVISSDAAVIDIAKRNRAEHMQTVEDAGHSADASLAVSILSERDIEKIALLPSDVPLLSQSDLHNLDMAHEDGITLCPATMDGGTNGLVFSPPLEIPLQYGKDSLNKFQQAATSRGIKTHLARIPGLEHDIDRLEDLTWLCEQPRGGQAWTYVRELKIVTG